MENIRFGAVKVPVQCSFSFSIGSTCSLGSVLMAQRLLHNWTVIVNNDRDRRTKSEGEMLCAPAASLQHNDFGGQIMVSGWLEQTVKMDREEEIIKQSECINYL